MDPDDNLIDVLRITIPSLFDNIKSNSISEEMLKKMGLDMFIGDPPVSDNEFYGFFHQLSISYQLNKSEGRDPRYMLALLSMAPFLQNRDIICNDAEMMFTLIECYLRPE